MPNQFFDKKKDRSENRTIENTYVTSQEQG